MSEWDDDVAWFDGLVAAGRASGFPCPHCGNNTVWRLWSWGLQSFRKARLVTNQAVDPVCLSTSAATAARR